MMEQDGVRPYTIAPKALQLKLVQHLGTQFMRGPYIRLDGIGPLTLQYVPASRSLNVLFPAVSGSS